MRFLHAYLAISLLIPAVAYLIFYAAAPKDLGEDLGMDMRSPVGVAICVIAILFAVGVLVWTFIGKRRSKGRGR